MGERSRARRRRPRLGQCTGHAAIKMAAPLSRGGATATVAAVGSALRLATPATAGLAEKDVIPRANPLNSAVARVGVSRDEAQQAGDFHDVGGQDAEGPGCRFGAGRTTREPVELPSGLRLLPWGLLGTRVVYCPGRIQCPGPRSTLDSEIGDTTAWGHAPVHLRFLQDAAVRMDRACVNVDGRASAALRPPRAPLPRAASAQAFLRHQSAGARSPP